LHQGLFLKINPVDQIEVLAKNWTKKISAILLEDWRIFILVSRHLPVTVHETRRLSVYERNTKKKWQNKRGQRNS
jgi:hypothetical protein